MGKKMKLKLEDLKVSSFVTSLDRAQSDELRGGINDTNPPVCDPDPKSLPNTCIIVHTDQCGSNGCA